MRLGPARKLRAAIAVAATSAVLLLAATGPAAADWSDSGPGSSSSTNGSTGSGGGGGTFHCGNWITGGVSGALYRKYGASWFRTWEYGYPSCVGLGPDSNWPKTGQLQLCPTGFLVYRFYGSLADPGSTAVTRSRTNLTQWCATEDAYSFPANTALDSGAPASTIGSPWRALVGTSGDQLNNAEPDVEYVRGEANTLVPGTPTKTTASSCQDHQSDSAIKTWFDKASPSEQVALRATLGQIYWTASEQGKYPATGLAEAGVGTGPVAPTGYRFSWANWLNNKSQAPAYDPNGDAFYLSTFSWETRDCASPFEFSSDSSANSTTRTLIGTCYIPLMRERVQMRRVGTTQTYWIWASLLHGSTSAGMGERLSNYYANTAYTPNGPGGDTLDASGTGLSPAQESQLISGWRSKMVDDYKAWAAAGLFTASGAQVVPLNPYVSEGDPGRLAQSTSVDVAAAADALRNDARCRVGTTIDAAVPKVTDAPDVSGTVTLSVADQKVLQVSPTAADVKITAGPLTCSSGACPTGTALASLEWTAAVSGTNGYRLCTVASATSEIGPDCDGAVWGGTQTAAGSITTSQVFHVRFVRPTSAAQVVRVELTGLKGTYTQAVKTTGMQVRGISPVSGTAYSIDTGALDTTITRDVSVKATGTPAPLSTAAAGYQVDSPVIGAVQVPSLS